MADNGYPLVPKNKLKAAPQSGQPFGPNPKPLGFAKGGGVAARQSFPAQTIGAKLAPSMPIPPVGDFAPAIPLNSGPAPAAAPLASPNAMSLRDAIYNGRSVSPKVGPVPAPAPASGPSVPRGGIGLGMSPKIGGSTPPVPKAAPLHLGEATFAGRSVSPKVGSVQTSAPATPWSASKAGALSSALQGTPQMGGPGPMSPAPPLPAPSAPAAPVGRLAGLAGGVKGLASRVGPSLGPMAMWSAISAASGNPNEGFMHLGGEGTVSGGIGRGLSSMGHAIAGESQPGDLTGADLGNAIMQHSWVGDTLGGIGQMGKTIGDFVSRPTQSTQEFGRGLGVLGDQLFGGGSPPEQPSGDTHLGITQHQMNGMNADQLNSHFASHGIGGDNPIAATPMSSALATSAPKSADAPSVQGQQQAAGGPAVYRGINGQDPAIQAMTEAMRTANWWNNTDGVASIGNALGNYKGAMGSNEAQMVGAQAHMFGARNPYGDMSNPVNLHAADAQLQAGGGLVGAAQANGIGLGPGGAISQQGLPAYMGARHPEFSHLMGNKDASIDQYLDIYNQSRAKFAPGDAQLSQLNNDLSQALRSRYTPEDMEAATQPGLLRKPFMWMGLAGDGGAGNNASGLHRLGLR